MSRTLKITTALVRCILCLAALSLASGYAESRLTDAGGAIVESIGAGSPAREVDLAAEDVLLSIRSAGHETNTGVPIRDPFDALVQRFMLGELGPVSIRFRRAGKAREVTLAADDWGVRLRPAFSTREHERYQRALHALGSRDVIGFCDGMQKIAEALEQEKWRRQIAWMHWRCAESAAEALDWNRSDVAMRKALEALVDDSKAAAAIWLLRGQQAIEARNWQQLKVATEKALSLVQGEATDSPIRLMAELLQGRVDLYESRFEKIEQLTSSLLQNCRLGTLLEADIRNLKALALRNLEHLDQAIEEYQKAITIRDRLAVASPDTASVHSNYAMALRAKGESSAAFAEMTTTIAGLRRISPESLRLASLLSNLALIHWDRGDLIAAERTYQSALSIQRLRAPAGYDVGISLQNLTYIALDRGDIAAAELLADESRAIFERVAPKSQPMGIAYNLHGLVLERRGDLDAADAEYHRAIAFWENAAPESLRHAWSIHNLGGTAEKRGDKAAARKFFEASLQMRHAAAPGGLDEANDLLSLGRLYLDSADTSQAHEKLDRAANIYSRIAPESVQYAITLNRLGHVIDSQGSPHRAIEYLCKAEQVLDLQRKRVSASRENQAEYTAIHADIPRECAEAHIQLDNPDAALEIIEHSRARAMRERMLFRDEAVAGEMLPTPLQERRRELYQRRARLEGELASLSREDAIVKREPVRSNLTALENDEEKWFADLAKQAPRYARGLRDKVLSVSQIFQRLPRDTAVLVYMVSKQHTFLLSLSSDDPHVRVAVLDIGRNEIVESVTRLRQRIVEREPRVTLDPELRRAYLQLVRPAESTIAESHRILFIPDGALQLLPFGALLDNSGRFVADRWTISLASSISVAMEASDDARLPGEDVVTVSVSAPRLNPADSERIGALVSLENSDTEATEVAAAYGGKTKIFLGDGAGEAVVRDAARGAKVLHIAAHGYFDTEHPIDSALLLGGGGARNSNDDGIVHAWEVMANWSLHSRLVVLSGCDTGVGRELADEGLIGLTRAFQYAGAQSVVATLWPISDRSTAGLMKNLHKEFSAGKDASSALREAQIQELKIHSSSLALPLRGVGGLSHPGRSSKNVERSHPYFWAGFEVFGVLP